MTFSTSLLDWVFPGSHPGIERINRDRIHIEHSFYLRADITADAGTDLLIFAIAFADGPPGYGAIRFCDVAGVRHWKFSLWSGAVESQAIAPVACSFSLWDTGDWYRLIVEWEKNGSDTPTLKLINETRDEVVEDVSLGAWLSAPPTPGGLMYGSGAAAYLTGMVCESPIVIRERRF